MKYTCIYDIYMLKHGFPNSVGNSKPWDFARLG